MSENIETPKNPLELALESFQKGTELIENSRVDLKELVDFVVDKQEEFKTQEIEFNEKNKQLINLLSTNLNLYKQLNTNLHSSFIQIIEQFQEDFQKLVNSSKLITLRLNDDDRKSIEATEKRLKRHQQFIFSVVGMSIILLLTTILSGYFSVDFYKTSVYTKTEARKEFLSQLEANGEIIVNKSIINAFANERKMIKNWSQSNPNDSKSYQSFRSGIISANSKQNIFKNLKDDEIIGK